MLKRISFLFLGMLLLFPVLAYATNDDPIDEVVYGAPGFNPHREYFNQAANEHVDPYTGNVLLSYTDIYLPGSGGLDLKIQRTYNSKIHNEMVNGPDASVTDLIKCDYAGVGWSLHMGRVYPRSSFYNPTPKIVMPDGSVHLAYYTDESIGWEGGGSSDEDIRLTKELWVYREDPPSSYPKYAYLATNDGTEYRFMIEGPEVQGAYLDDWYPVDLIRDVFGNEISIVNAVDRGHFVIDEIEMSDGRVVNFNYTYANSSAHLPDKITVTTPAGNSGTATYTYRFSVDTSNTPNISTLTSVELPTGLKWGYDYATSNTTTHKEYELEEVTYPTGAEIDYKYDTLYTTVLGRTITSRVVDKRIVANKKDVTPGTWEYSYSRGISGVDTTTVTGPEGFEEVYEFWGPKYAGSGENFLIGSIKSKELYDGSSLLQTDVYNWNHKRTIGIFPYCYSALSGCDNETYVPVQTKRTTTRGSDDYTITFSNFNSQASQYNYFPKTIVESGEQRKTTTRTFWHNSGLHIIGLVDDETIVSGGETFHIKRNYYGGGVLDYLEEFGVKTDYSYWGGGHLKSVTDERGHGVTYAEYQYGQPRKITTGNYYYRQTINPAGTLESITRETKTKSGAVSHTTLYSYDKLNRLTQVNTPLEANLNISYPYSSSVGLKKIVGKGGAWTEYTYDGFGRVSFVIDSGGVKQDIDYDALGYVSYKSYPYYSTNNVGDSFQHDTLGRVRTVTHPDNESVVYTYPSGNRVNIVNERSLTTQNYYRSFGDPDEKRLVKVIDAGGQNATVYFYNAVGSLTRVTQAGIPDRVFKYGLSQGENLLAYEIHPESGRTDYSYYSNGMIYSKTVGNDTTSYGYDTNNRLKSINYPGSDYDVTFEHDNSDNRTKMTMASNVNEYWYNSENRLTDVEFYYRGINYPTVYDYDSRGNLDYIKYPSGRIISNISYDLANRVTSVPGFVNNITYHPSGGMIDISLANNLTHSYTYDPFRYWVRTIKGGQDGSVVDLSYVTYDYVGNLKTLTDNLHAERSKLMTYTAIDQLDTVNSTILGGLLDYGYDNFGNRKSLNNTIYTYDYTKNRLDSIGSYAFTYDANGNFTNNDAYEYDYANRLISTGNASFTYNGDGQRIEKVVGADSTVYHYDASGNVIAETNAQGATKAEYVYVNGMHVAKVPKMLLDEVILDFGLEDGTWVYFNDTLWTELHTGSPEFVVTGDMDGNGQDEVVVAFGDPTPGIWVKYNNDASWVKLHNTTPDSITAADMDGNGKDELIIDFGDAVGLWTRYNDISWVKLHPTSPGVVAAGDMDGNGKDEVIIDFGATGIWGWYNNETWVKLHASIPDSITTADMDGNGKDELIIDFGDAAGLWTRYNDISWVKLHPTSPGVVAAGDMDGNGKDEVIIDFGATGIWVRYNDSSWTKLHSLSPDIMVTGDMDGTGKDEVIIDFGATGTWVRYNDSSWTKLHSLSPEIMVTGNIDGQ